MWRPIGSARDSCVGGTLMRRITAETLLFVAGICTAQVVVRGYLSERQVGNGIEQLVIESSNEPKMFTQLFDMKFHRGSNEC